MTQSPLSQDSNSTESQLLVEHKILSEIVEDEDHKQEVMLRVEAIEDIRQTLDKYKWDRIHYWANQFGKHPRTITRWLEKVEKEGLAAIAKTVRSDAGKLTGNKKWKHSVEYWVEFIVKTYKEGKKISLGLTRSLVYNQVQGHAELELGLKKGEYPSHMFVYKVLNPLIQQQNRKIRNPGQGPGIIIKVTDNQKNQEDITVIRSNQVWQIDHTALDNLLTDANGELVGTVWITSIIDTWSGCVMGYQISYDSPGSHEVAIALRHAILPKDKHSNPDNLKKYDAPSASDEVVTASNHTVSPENEESSNFQMKKKWEVCGLPECIVTDRAKEFKSGHLRRIASELGFKLFLRLYTEQGGVVERSFLGLKTEFSALIPGYKGGSLKERPKNPEKYACLTYEEYDEHLARYFVDHHNQHLYPRVKNQTRLMRWKVGLINGSPRMPDSERCLDICLMKEARRRVQRRGSVDFLGTTYTASLSRDEEGYWKHDLTANFLKDYEGELVTLRYNPSNIIYILIYTHEKKEQASEFLGTLRARDLKEEQLSLKEWQKLKQDIRDAGKKIDQSSILAQQKDLFSSSKSKAKKTRRERRKAEHHRLTRKSNHSNHVRPNLPTDDPSQQHQPQKHTPSTCVSQTNQSQEQSKSTQFISKSDNLSPEEFTEVSVKPALFVISDWDNFLEGND